MTRLVVVLSLVMILMSDQSILCPKFLRPTSCDDYEVKTIFELFYRDLHIDNNDLLTTTQVRSRLFNLSKLFHKNNLKKLERNLPKSELSALHKLAKNTGLVIAKPDKGNGAVILDKNDYNTKS